MLTEWNALQKDRSVNLLLTEQIGPAIIRLPSETSILVPQALWEEASEPVRRGIVKHELSHVQHQDDLKSFLFSTLAALQWFNPVSWYALRRFDEAAEWWCDAEAYGNDKNSSVLFAESLLLLQKTTPRYVGTLKAFKSPNLDERLRRLTEHSTNPQESMMKKLLLASLMTVLFCCGLVKITLVAQLTQSPTQSPPREQGTNVQTLANATGSVNVAGTSSSRS